MLCTCLAERRCLAIGAVHQLMCLQLCTAQPLQQNSKELVGLCAASAVQALLNYYVKTCPASPESGRSSRQGSCKQVSMNQHALGAQTRSLGSWLKKKPGSHTCSRCNNLRPHQHDAVPWAALCEVMPALELGTQDCTAAYVSIPQHVEARNPCPAFLIRSTDTDRHVVPCCLRHRSTQF